MHVYDILLSAAERRGTPERFPAPRICRWECNDILAFGKSRNVVNDTGQDFQPPAPKKILFNIAQDNRLCFKTKKKIGQNSTHWGIVFGFKTKDYE